ncbi:MAG TPA: hypothetical protein VK934_13160 [Fimbriimonas sp.]|nr:hypothetical protein [Fimbriimonas sp.]
MVKALEKALDKVRQLPEEQQETLAALIEAELHDERRWRTRFAETPGTLQKLADRAKTQYERGLCDEL